MCTSSYCGTCKVNFLWGSIYWGFEHRCRPLLQRSRCLLVLITEGMKIGSCGHSNCLHAVKLPCSILCTVLHRGGCAVPSSGVNMGDAALLCTAALFLAACPAPEGTALRLLSPPFESEGASKTARSGWGSSITKMWARAGCMDALGWLNELWIGDCLWNTVQLQQLMETVSKELPNKKGEMQSWPV